MLEDGIHGRSCREKKIMHSSYVGEALRMHVTILHHFRTNPPVTRECFYQRYHPYTESGSVVSSRGGFSLVLLVTPNPYV